MVVRGAVATGMNASPSGVFCTPPLPPPVRGGVPPTCTAHFSLLQNEHHTHTRGCASPPSLVCFGWRHTARNRRPAPTTNKTNDDDGADGAPAARRAQTPARSAPARARPARRPSRILQSCSCLVLLFRFAAARLLLYLASRHLSARDMGCCCCARVRPLNDPADRVDCFLHALVACPLGRAPAFV